MATSGIRKTNVTYDSYFWVKWSQASQDIASNKTRITWSCGVYCGHNFYSNAIKMSAVTINGTRVYAGGTYSNFNIGNHTIASGSLDIPHNADGTKTFTLSAFTGWLYSNYNYSSSATNYTLNTIPRRVIVTAGEDFDDEHNPKLTFTNPAGFEAMPYLDFYADDGTYIGGFSRTKGQYASPYTFELTVAERGTMLAMMREYPSCKVREGFVTYNGEENIGSSYIEKRLTIINAYPTIDAESVTVIDSDSSIVEITGNNKLIILGKSTARASWAGATAKKQATIVNYKVEWQGSETTITGTNTLLVLTASGTSTLKITVTDSRGLTAEASKQVTILPYAPPNAVVSYGRVNNYEDDTKLKIDGSFSSIKDDNTEKNSITCQWRSRQNIDGTSWSNWTTVQDNVENTYTFDKNNEYVIECKVTDAFGGTWTKQYVLLKGKFPLFIDTGMNAVGINDFPKTGEALRVIDGLSHFIGGATINNQFASDVLAFAQACDIGFTPFNTGENTANLPNDAYKYSVGYVHRRTSDQITIFVNAYNSNQYAMKTLLGENWTEWSFINSCEVGIKDGWRYKKWSDGFIEMWGRKQVSFGNTWTSVGGHYRAVATVTIPFSIPYANRLSIQGTASVAGAYFFTNSENETAGTDKIEIIGYKETSGNVTYTPHMSLYVAGML